jgi:hypothetical protein
MKITLSFLLWQEGLSEGSTMVALTLGRLFGLAGVHTDGFNSRKSELMFHLSEGSRRAFST